MGITQSNTLQQQPLHIAYISYEHPLGITGGGIGTYVAQLARLMTNRRHWVEVFTGYNGPAETVSYDGYTVHRINAATHNAFREEVVATFAKRHTQEAFDLIEAAEYGADALYIKQQFPHLPMAVKLHTPSFLVHRLNTHQLSLKAKARFIVGALRRGRMPQSEEIANPLEELEEQQYNLADAVCSPTVSLADIVGRQWGRREEISLLPNIFNPSPELLQIPPTVLATPVVAFFGKLEKRKGILDLAEAIPMVLQQQPNVRFLFVGSAHTSPDAKLNMAEYISKRVGRWKANLEFSGFQPYSAIPGLMATSAIGVFPSLWENFPNVCLEAMAAGRPVVASNSGGMAEMIEHRKSGLLVPPNSPAAIAEAIIELVANPETARSLGMDARKRVLHAYSGEQIGMQVEQFYQATISTASSTTFDNCQLTTLASSLPVQQPIIQ